MYVEELKTVSYQQILIYNALIYIYQYLTIEHQSIIIPNIIVWPESAYRALGWRKIIKFSLKLIGSDYQDNQCSRLAMPITRVKYSSIGPILQKHHNSLK